jgi:hypothetical protein
MSKPELEAQEALPRKFLFSTSLFDTRSITDTDETENGRVPFRDTHYIVP